MIAPLNFSESSIGSSVHLPQAFVSAQEQFIRPDKKLHHGRIVDARRGEQHRQLNRLLEATMSDP
jgi:hypothetical protein